MLDASFLTISTFRPFFDISPCISTYMVLMRESIIRNETDFFTFRDETELGAIFTQCLEYEEDIR